MGNKFSFPIILIVFTLLVILILSLVSPAAQAAFNVTCTVPSATYPTIQSAVNDAGCDVIDVAEGIFYEQINIVRPLTVQGSGANVTIINGGAGGSVFTIDSTAVTINDVAITNGSSSSGAGIHNLNSNLTISGCHIHKNWAPGSGGGIYSIRGNVDIIHSAIEANEADSGGGIFFDDGTLTVSHSQLVSNEGGFHGGGLYMQRDGTATLENVSVIENITYVDGGGIFNYGTMTINNSSISKNVSTNYSGGGLRNEGNIFISNSTISGNEDGFLDGSAISNWFGTVRLNNVTISNNSHAPALDNYDGNIRVQNSIIAANPGKDCKGTIHSDGYNLIGSTEGCDFREAAGDILNSPVNLGPLQGDPSYQPLLLGPGINMGNPEGCKNNLGQLLETDQRGLPRIGRCDMGAFEFQGTVHQAYFPLVLPKSCPDFYDDYSNPNSGWYSGEDDYVLAGYLIGEYQIATKQEGYLYLFESPTCDRTNYIVNVTARWEGLPGAGYGIAFQIKGDFDQYYVFGVNSDYEMFWLDRKGPNGWQTLIDATYHDAIRSGNQQNLLQINRRDDKIRLEINGQHVGTFYDDVISGPSGSGIFSMPYNERPYSDARFDNFSSRLITSAVIDLSAIPQISAVNGPRSNKARVPYQPQFAP